MKMRPFTRRQLLKSTLVGSVGLLTPLTAQAASRNPVLFDGTEITDWPTAIGELSFNRLPPTFVGGTVALDPAQVAQLGYDPNRTWQPDTPVSDVLMLGDIQLPTVFGPQQFSLTQIAQMAYQQARGWTQQQVEQWLGTLKLSEFGITKLQSVSDLVTAIPTLADQLIDDVIPVRDLFDAWQGVQGGNYGQTIRALLDSFPQFGSEVMGQLDLSRYGLSSIPNITRNPISAFRKWAQGRISEIPGLPDVPWARFAISSLLTGRFAKIDLILGAKEGLRNVFRNTVTGSSNQGFNVECGNQTCPHIEFTGEGFRGSRHIINPVQSLDGGFGILKYVNGGREGAGWEPFGGDGPKVGVVNLSEKPERVGFGLYFYIDAWWFGSHLGRTPKFIGVPFFTASVKQWIPSP